MKLKPIYNITETACTEISAPLRGGWVGSTAQDYYPFGMLMPSRTFSSDKYRFGFNGKENDNEVKGTGDQQDYGMRIYDPRLGRFLSVDPITNKYPELTPYQFASNSPINGIDLDGLEWATPAVMCGAYNPCQVAKSIGEIKTDPKSQAVGRKVFTAAYLIAKFGVITTTMVAQPEVGIPWAVSDLSGLPVTPSPQAWEAPVLNAVEESTPALQGGSKASLPKSSTLERHEIPSNSVLKSQGIQEGEAPAIQVPHDVHVKTGSFGGYKSAMLYRKQELELISQGKYTEAFEKGINDLGGVINAIGGNMKDYQKAINAARNYYNKVIVPQLKINK